MGRGSIGGLLMWETARCKRTKGLYGRDRNLVKETVRKQGNGGVKIK